MPGARSRVKPAPASDISVSDEASVLELHLQRQLEDDVARIFDESIYSDIEVVCGKLKILTHSCILKARTNNFYHKLETILHANIGRNTFDEIYSFISDAYTECNIKYQEKEIITYLDDNLNVLKSVAKNTLNIKDETDEPDVFLTPKCVTPYVEKSFQKSISASPSTELTKEYYALVPIEGSLLDKELIEQDVLSNAFKSIIKSQGIDFNKAKIVQNSKPTSLSLSSSHICKTVKHSSSCDILNNLLKENDSSRTLKSAEKKVPTCTSQNLIKNNKSAGLKNNIDENYKNSESFGNKPLDVGYSPDSLITDDPSSSSDYLSAAYACSPRLSTSGGIPQLNVGDSVTKMENTFTSSDSGLENTGLLESLNSHKDVTLTDVSLTESTLHDLNTDETNDSVSSSFIDKNQIQRFNYGGSQSTVSGTSSDKDFMEPTSNQLPELKDTVSCKSSKEEKQRQNEEIVILESSSLSSETGSWESVFPPKLSEKEICEKFITRERQNCNEGEVKHRSKVPSTYTETLCTSLVQKSPFKSTSCFIDAASLADEEDETIKVQTDAGAVLETARSDVLPAPSQPLPCSTAKFDVSPNVWSESNDNDDSLEQLDNRDPDSIQKDLSPTIFEMTPVTEDSLCTNAFENAIQAEESHKKLVTNNEVLGYTSDKDYLLSSNTVVVSGTPNNSIMSLKASALKQCESEESESDTTVVCHENNLNIKKPLMKFNESSPIVSGGASIEDHLPQMASYTGSPLTRRRFENMPIVSGAYIAQIEENHQKKSSKPSTASAWVVDMSNSIKSDADKNSSYINNSGVKKPGDRTCELLRNGSKSSLDSCHSLENNKSLSSVDSDGSEKSSHKFYIDLSSLPDPILSQKNNECEISEKKNIFSMYIDLGEKPTKEMPARLSSSLNTKRNVTEAKNISKSFKSGIACQNETCADVTKRNDGVTSLCNFEKYESLCNDPNINISEIINILDSESSSKTSTKDNSKIETAKLEKSPRSAGIDRSRHRSTTSTAKAIQEEPTVGESNDNDLFVKLSDLDKPVHKNEPSSCTIFEEKVLDVRMTRSIPENTWGDQSNAGPSRSIEVISSFHSENALSLNRLFPHLKNEFSRSMPGSLSGQSRSPLRLEASSSAGNLEEQTSDVSEISSVQSSMCRSVIENSTTEDTSQTSSLIGNCQSRLGQDLLRMFLQEIAPDVIVEVSGRRIKAHKCILSSRCQYFAGILSGGWVESAGNVIVLPPFSYNVVHFALCHIYSGLSTIPDSVSIVELATIADMLGLEGLKEAIMFTLKAKYCHHFHRPCQVCSAGVLECFPLSSVYGLDDLYRKCLRWITKYFAKVWPTKAFATLPKELLDKCYQQHIINMTIENLVDTVYGCGITVASLQNSRWAESVARMCRRLVNAAAHFAAPRLVAVLRAAAPLAPDAPSPARQALDDCLAAAIEWAPPDEACRAYAFLSALVKDIRSQQYSKPDLITNGNQSKSPGQSSLLHGQAQACSWRLQCEGALVRAAPRVVGTHAFKELPADLRKRLRELGCIMYGAQPLPITSTPLLDRQSKNPKNKIRNSNVTNSLDIDHVRASFVPYAAKPIAPVGSMDALRSNNDLRDKKMKGFNPPKIRTTKAQEERAKFNLSKNNQSQDRLTKTVPARLTFENTKPRYLEPRMSKESDRNMGAERKLVQKMISSSESSRNSSPILARNLRTSRLKSRVGLVARTPACAGAGTLSQDSLATSSRPRTAEPSTDSLSESQSSNKYATYTKFKHTKGFIESVNSAKYLNAPQISSGNKCKTKIPVYLNQAAKPNNGNSKYESQKKCTQSVKSVNNISNVIQNRGRVCERKIPGSLMSATKSSSAKMVPKIVKESAASKYTAKQGKKNTSHANKQMEQEKPPDIPVMERSGTFLKDEPTFGDKTTNFDIDRFQ